MDEGNTEEVTVARAPELPDGSSERAQPRAALIAIAVLVIAGTVAMATRTGSGPSRAAAPAVQARPDVIIIAIDGLGVAEVSGAGTPFLQGFGAGSVSYRDAYAPSPWASEALSGLLTGQHRPVSRGTEGWTPGLADELLRRGYRTALVPGHRRHAFEGAGLRPGPAAFEEVLLPAGLDDPAGAQGSSVAQAALGWLAESARPGLLVVTLADPRAPHHLYRGGEGGPGPGYEGPIEPGMAHDDLLRIGPDLDDTDRAQLAALHATEVAAADAFARQLVEGARQHRDLAPVIAIAGLRQPALGERGRYGLVPSMEPEDLRVPLWLEVPAASGGGRAPGEERVPGEGGGRRTLRGVVGAPVSLLDLGPTLLCALGLEPRLDLDGASVFPGSAMPERPLRAATSRGICAVVGLDGDRAVILEAEPPAALVRSRRAGVDPRRGLRWGPCDEVTGVDADLRLQLARWMRGARIGLPGGGVPDLEAAPFTP